MLNYVWFFLLVSGFLISIVNGRTEQVTRAALDAASGAVELSLGLLGIMCLWSGLMRIAEKSGLTDFIARAAKPLLQYLFPGIPRRHPALGAVVLNLAANFLGLGNAATPLGIKAMNELQKLNPVKDTATDSMCMFLVLNTSVIQLVPATIIALRAAAGARNPADVMGAIWFATLCSSVAGITAAKIFARLSAVKLRKVSRKTLYTRGTCRKDISGSGNSAANVRVFFGNERFFGSRRIFGYGKIFGKRGILFGSRRNRGVHRSGSHYGSSSEGSYKNCFRGNYGNSKRGSYMSKSRGNCNSSCAGNEKIYSKYRRTGT